MNVRDTHASFNEQPGSVDRPAGYSGSIMRLSLRTRVFLWFAAGVLGVFMPALWLATRAVEERIYRRATEDLIQAGVGLTTYWNLADEALLTQARAAALSPGVARALARARAERLMALLDRRVLGPREVLAADSTGRVIVGPELDADALLRPSLALAAGAGSAYARALVAWPRGAARPLRLALWPVWDENRLAGVVGVGVWLDSMALRELREVAHAGLALVVHDSTTPSIVASLPPAQARALAEVPALRRPRSWGPDVVVLAGQPYLAQARFLPARGLPTLAVLLRPVRQELQLMTSIRRALWAIGLGTVGLALALAWLVSRAVARPAQTLARAALRLAEGDYAAPLPAATADEIGQLTGAFGRMRQAIAEREQRLRQAQIELLHREKLAAMGRLVAQLSHELNNPLYNLQNCLEALARRSDPRDPNREFLDLAREELQRLVNLTQRLLDQGRPLPDGAREVDLNRLVERVLALARPGLEASRIAIETDLEPGLPPVHGHPDSLQQVLVNLIDNARDAMPHGGVLRLRTRARDDHLELIVEDTGVGIAPEHRSRIFEAFFTTKPGVHGVGLGLFVVEGIVRGHRGRIEVDSAPGHGTRFVVALPRQPWALEALASGHQEG